MSKFIIAQDGPDINDYEVGYSNSFSITEMKGTSSKKKSNIRKDSLALDDSDSA